jgi:aspartyl-tRNA(Asn)/glutamyl-tRNA(Gln) amidotransferase subunit A
VPNFRAEINGGVKGLRIGVIRHYHEVDHAVGEPTRNALDDALSVLQDLGAEIRDVKLSPLADYAACAWMILTTEAYAVHEPWLKSEFNSYGELLRDRLALGGLTRGVDYVQAMRRRRELCVEMASMMAGLDVLVTAVQPNDAPRIDEVPKWAMFEKPSLMAPFNVTGYPAISVCTGFGPGGLPLGMQLVAKPFAEPLLFRAAHAYETATPWRTRRPEMKVEASGVA